MSPQMLRYELAHWISVRDTCRDLAGKPVNASPQEVIDRINWLEWKLATSRRSRISWWSGLFQAAPDARMARIGRDG